MSGSAELCRERPNENSRTKYYDDSHTTDKDARHPEELVPRREKRRVALPIPYLRLKVILIGFSSQRFELSQCSRILALMRHLALQLRVGLSI